MSICSADGCGVVVECKGLCSKHYARSRRAESGAGVDRTWEPLETRFWRFVEKTDTCWLWRASALNNKGYGMIGGGHERGNKRLLAHRLSYEIHKGEIGHGLVVMHTCDNKRCVNPDHLVVGTQKQNTHDAIAKGIKPPPPVERSRGVKHGLSKLNDDIVREIRSCTSMTLQEMANKYGVSVPTIYCVRSRRTWSHVE